MNRNVLKVQMYSPKGNHDIIEEIKDEYIKGGHNLSFVQPREKFYNDLEKQFELFDFISHALIIDDRKTMMHLVQKGTRFGIFAGTNLSLILPTDYIQIIPINLGRALGIQFMAMNDNCKWGITKERHFWDKEVDILPFEFDDIKTPTTNFYPVKKDGKWGLYYSIRKDMVITPQYEDAIGLSEGLYAVKKGDKWGFVDIFNNVVVPFEYDSVTTFSSGYSHAKMNTNSEKEVLQIVDHSGRRTEFNNKKLEQDEYRKKITIKESYENHIRYYYAIGIDGDIIIPQNKYRYLGCYREGLFAASIDGVTYGYIDLNEHVVIPFQYQLETYPSSFGERVFNFGFVCAKLNNKECILINHANEQIFPYSFKKDLLTYSNGAWGYTMNLAIGDRFKKLNISLYDLICFKKGFDMSYLIRTDEEVEIERRKKERQRELEGPYQWTEEDSWDAMTDGMYGDYPGGDVDYDKFGF